MAMSTAGIISRASALLLLATVTFVKPSYALKSNGFEIFARTSSCASNYDYCGSDLPSDFCCKSSETCLVVDNNSTVVCCPSGDDCSAIATITCNIQQQNATAHPTAAVKTTLLDETLTECGDGCCPFGYSCKDSYCVVNTTSTTSSTTSTSSSTESSTSSSTASTTPTSSSSTSTSSGTSVTPIAGSVSASSINADSTSGTCTSSCPSFPGKAVIAGFFPGAVLGAIIALLLSTCICHRKEKKHELEVTQVGKGGPSWSISSPIATEDNSYRTDFLLRTSKDKHASVGSRVRSLFSNGQPKTDKDVPPLPRTNVESLTPPEPVTPPRQREPSTESIKVYSPPGAFVQSRRFLGPEPYPSRIARPSTTFSDLVQAVGFNETKGGQAKEGKSFKVHQVRKIT